MKRMLCFFLSVTMVTLTQLDVLSAMAYADYRNHRGCSKNCRSCSSSYESQDSSEEQDCKYRSLNGEGNNPCFPSWGKSNTCLQRFMTPDYADDKGLPRSSNCGVLPSPIKVYEELHYELSLKSKASYLLMQYCAFIALDTCNTDNFEGSFAGPIDCCPPSDTADDPNVCYQILIEKDVPWAIECNKTCISFVRNKPCDTSNSGRREQENAATHFLDGSALYGNTAEEANALRNPYRPGEMKTMKIKCPGSCPKVCRTLPRDPSTGFFLSGSSIVNAQGTFVMVHSCFVNYHNRIATLLRENDECLRGDELYHATRRIVAAIIQNIWYREVLPHLIGEAAMDEYNLTVKPIEDDSGTAYDITKNPTIWNEFNTVALRTFHSIVPDTYPDGYGGFLPLKYDHRNMTPIENCRIDQVLKGMTELSAQKRDEHVERAATRVDNELPVGDRCGVSVTVFDIQRGREHGMPSYKEFVKYFRDIDINSFDDLNKMKWSKSCLKKITKLFNCVEDIDPITGMMCEKSINGAMVGRTALEIIRRQFSDMKFGDRYYFEHEGQCGSFTKEQRRAIKEVNMAQVLCKCQNCGQPFHVINEDVFSYPNRGRTVKCSDLKFIDLEPFYCQNQETEPATAKNPDCEAIQENFE